MADLTKLPQAAAGCMPAGVTDRHGKDAFEVRFGTATAEAVKTGTVTHTNNGDEALYPDKSGTYTKCIKQKTYGVVDPPAFLLFRKATQSGVPSDFEAPGMLGAGRKLNGPLGAYALQLIGEDSEGFGDSVVPPPPAVASKQYATELVELYWASLLRDVPFSDFPSNPIAKAAAAELTTLKATYAGPVDGGKVTPQLLFRGGITDPTKTFFGENFGPYVSQLCITPTNLGAQAIDQKMATLAAGVDYLTNLDAWQAVQNGVGPLPPARPGGARSYMNTGRCLAAFTHVDELYQAYLTAYLVMNTLGVPTNPGSPYTAFVNQQAFGTFGGPDVVSTLGIVARAAINAVWYQKWVVHLRHRPESGGGLVHLLKTGIGGVDATLDSIVLDSMAVQQSLVANGSYLLSQAFPEGSPAHPAYPTGHGTVAGACITALKFFYDGSTAISNPMVPTSDGSALEPYTGADASKMTINGELHKLAHNISFGHGIHAGIHWRSDTDSSMLLGEAVGLKCLHDLAWAYREDFSINITKMDGSTEKIKNF